MTNKTATMRRRKTQKGAVKLRLSYIFLDIFLGTFVVGVVLMTTLGRPNMSLDHEGSGGLPYFEIQFEWTQGDAVFAPMVWYNGCPLNPAGLGANFSPQNVKTVWPQYNTATGELRLPQVGHSGVWVDGFFTDGTPLNLSNDINRVGYLLISEPKPGQWSFGVRVVDSPAALGSQASVEGEMEIRWSDLDIDSEEESVKMNFRKQLSSDAILSQRRMEASLFQVDEVDGLIELKVNGDLETQSCERF